MLTRPVSFVVVSLLVLTLVPTASASLITTFQVTGNVGAEVAAFPTSAAGTAAGNLTLSSIPAGATILKATLYGNNYFASLSPSATFAGNPLGATAAFATDGGLSTYQWDVTGLVTGNGTFNASFSGLSNSYGLALAVAFSHPSLPIQTVSINDGAIDHVGGTRSTIFNTFGAGAGSLWIHTGADNNGFGQSGELINFNGVTIGGPIDANLGPFASLFHLPVNTIAGVNTLDILDPNQDQFGWHLAVLVSPGQSVPEPATLTLIGVGLLGAAAFRARRPRARS